MTPAEGKRPDKLTVPAVSAIKRPEHKISTPRGISLSNQHIEIEKDFRRVSPASPTRSGVRAFPPAMFARITPSRAEERIRT
jgi:hypothetical protein